MEKKSIVFLYTEIASYFLACIETLSAHPGVAITVVRWPVNQEAPFKFSLPENISFRSRKDFATDEELISFVRSLDPSLIFSSGWVDAGYMKVCKFYRKSIPVIVGFDNHWTGSMKQQVARLVSPFRILNHFSHCWVPGSPQEIYARKLGFKKDRILTGFYSCDFAFFEKHYMLNREKKRIDFPKCFIYVGRYYEFKGIRNLWTAFIELQQEDPNKWELWCLGNGNIEPVEHRSIRHFGFVQPADLVPFLRDAGVFVLPSLFEPWGVVVHEFASAGFPLICSDQVGASTAFVVDNYNGYIYKSDSISELKAAMKKIMTADPEDLNRMSERSVSKGREITPEVWAKKLIDLIYE